MALITILDSAKARPGMLFFLLGVSRYARDSVFACELKDELAFSAGKRAETLTGIELNVWLIRGKVI